MGIAGDARRFIGLPQFVVERGLLTSSGQVMLEGAEAAHLSISRRLRKGQVVRLADGSGRVVVARIERISRAGVYLDVIHELGERDDLIPCVFLLSIFKRDRFELSVAKLAEIGIAAIQPVLSRRSMVSGKEPDRLKKRARRWQKICIEGLKQSRGFKATRVYPPLGLADATERLGNTACRVALLAGERGRGLLDKLSGIEEIFPCAVAVGPEGGFDPEEKRLLASMGFVAGGLGSRILRSETAAVYSAALLSEMFLSTRCIL